MPGSGRELLLELEFAVSAITERRFAGMFAPAKEHPTVFLSGVLLRAEIGVFVGPITKGLLAGLTTSTPEIALALSHFDDKGRLLGDGWWG